MTTFVDDTQPTTDTPDAPDEVAGSEGPIPGWVVLELMGHRRMAGWVSEVTVAGREFLRIDVPGAPPETAEWVATQMYSSGAVYCISPVSEEQARLVARVCSPAPITRPELTAGHFREFVALSDDDDDGF